MPIYEYECESCKTRHEILQRLSDPPMTACPACAGTVRKCISASGLSFKGSGWYITDYARKTSEEKPAAKTADTPAAPATEKSTEPKSPETKPTETKSTAPKPATTKSPETKPKVAPA